MSHHVRRRLHWSGKVDGKFYQTLFHVSVWIIVSSPFSLSFILALIELHKYVCVFVCDQLIPHTRTSSPDLKYLVPIFFWEKKMQTWNIQRFFNLPLKHCKIGLLISKNTNYGNYFFFFKSALFRSKDKRHMKVWNLSTKDIIDITQPQV